MPMWLHIIFAVVIAIYFLMRFLKEKQIYELIFVIWVPSTLLQYLTTNPTFLKALGILQVVMFLLVVYFMFKRRSYRRHKTAEILAKYSVGDLDNAIPMSDDNLNQTPTNANLEEKSQEDKENISK